MDQNHIHPVQYTYPAPLQSQSNAYTQQPSQWPYLTQDFPYTPFQQHTSVDQHGQPQEQSPSGQAEHLDEASEEDEGTLQVQQYDPATRTKTPTTQLERLHQSVPPSGDRS